MSTEKAKILIIGPSRSGKTNIANLLSGTKDTPTTDYKETAPLRILETQLEGVKLAGRRMGKGTKVVIELWDVGGSPKFQSCWPAMYKNADGIIYVFNPEVKGQEKELELWYKNFAQPANMPDKHCLVFSHHSSPPEIAVGSNAIPPMPRSLQQVRCMETSLDFKSDDFKSAFEKLIEVIIMDKREAEENAMMKDDEMGGSGPVRFGGSRQEM